MLDDSRRGALYVRRMAENEKAGTRRVGCVMHGAGLHLRFLEIFEFNLMKMYIRSALFNGIGFRCW